MTMLLKLLIMKHWPQDLGNTFNNGVYRVLYELIKHKAFERKQKSINLHRFNFIFLGDLLTAH